MRARVVVIMTSAISFVRVEGIQLGRSKDKDQSSEKAITVDPNVVSSIKNDLKSVEATVTGIEEGLKNLGSGIHGLDAKVDKVENRISGLDSDMDQIEKKLDEVLQRFITMERVPNRGELHNGITDATPIKVDSGVIFSPHPAPAMLADGPGIPLNMAEDNGIPPPPPLPPSLAAPARGGPPPPPPPPPVGIFSTENKVLWGGKRNVQTTMSPPETNDNSPGLADVAALAAERARKMSTGREQSIEEKIAASRLERQYSQQRFSERLRNK